MERQAPIRTGVAEACPRHKQHTLHAEDTVISAALRLATGHDLLG